MTNVSEVLDLNPNLEYSDAIASNTQLGSTAIAADDAIESSVQPSEILPLITKFRTLPSDGLVQNLKSYLSKPQIIASGTLSSTDVASTFGDFSTSAGLFTTMLSAKLSGVLSVSYTAVITLQVNANRFQQGLYLLSFVPTGGMYEDAQATSWRNMHRFSRCQITQLPHVLHDISCDTSVQLKIPFKSSFPAIPYKTATTLCGDPGRIFLYPYVPLASASGSTTAGYTIWIHYENVVLGGHTVPQSGDDRRGFKQKKNVDIGTQERDTEGPISGVLLKVVKASNILSEIPLLSSVTSPVAWFSSVLARSAQVFGWSKPILATPPGRMLRQPFPYLCNYDAHDGTNSIAVSTDNRVEVMPSFAGCDLDEMSMQFVTSIPSWYITAAWNTAGTAGTNITTQFAGVDTYTVSQTDGTTAVNSYLPLKWVSRFFNWYSGGIIIKLHIAKTEFHSGRLLFWFTPFESLLGNVNTSHATTSYVHKQILDIRETNEFLIEIPFVSITPWRPTTGTGTNFGRWGINILDPLVAPATVSSFVSIVVEVAGSQDLIFSSPRSFTEGYVVPFALQSGGEQSENRPCLSTVSTIGGTTENTIDHSKESCCVGESISNFRVLLKRGGFMNSISNSEISSGTRITIVPRAFTAMTGQAAANPVVVQRCNDIFSHLSSVYAMNRGGVRLKLVPSMTHVATNYMTQLEMRNSNSSDLPLPISTSGPGFFNNYWRGANSNWNISQILGGGPDIQAPMYNWLHAFPSGANMVTDVHSIDSEMRSAADHSAVHFMPCNTDDDFEDNFFNVYRSGADDCNFGLFASIPPMWDPGDPE
jgi:hypothetical protein